MPHPHPYVALKNTLRKFPASYTEGQRNIVRQAPDLLCKEKQLVRINYSDNWQYSVIKQALEQLGEEAFPGTDDLQNQLKYSLAALGIKYEDVVYLSEISSFATHVDGVSWRILDDIDKRQYEIARYNGLNCFYVLPRTIRYLARQSDKVSITTTELLAKLKERGISLNSKPTSMLALQEVQSGISQYEIDKAMQCPSPQNLSTQRNQLFLAQGKIDKSPLRIDNNSIANYAKTLHLSGEKWTENGLIISNCIPLQNGGYRVYPENSKSLEALRKLQQEALDDFLVEGCKTLTSLAKVAFFYEKMSYEEKYIFVKKLLLDILKQSSIIENFEKKNDEDLLGLASMLNNFPTKSWDDFFKNNPAMVAILQRLNIAQYICIIERLDIDNRLFFLENRFLRGFWPKTITCLSDVVKIAQLLHPYEFSVLLNYLRNTRGMSYQLPAQFKPSILVEERWNPKKNTLANLNNLFWPLQGIVKFFYCPNSSDIIAKQIKNYLSEKPHARDQELSAFLLERLANCNGQLASPQGENAKRLIYALEQISKGESLKIHLRDEAIEKCARMVEELKATNMQALAPQQPATSARPSGM